MRFFLLFFSPPSSSPILSPSNLSLPISKPTILVHPLLIFRSSPFPDPPSSSVSHFSCKHTHMKLKLCLWIWVLFCFVGFYSLCDGPKLSRGPYLAAAMACSSTSLVFVSVKALFMFGEMRIEQAGAMEMALFGCSLVLAVGHIAVAYRTSCRQRRKLRVFQIDIEAVRISISCFQFPLIFRLNKGTKFKEYYFGS